MGGDHFCAGHPTQDPSLHNNNDLVGDDDLVAAGVVADAELCQEVPEDDEVGDGAFARLRMAGLL